MILIMPATIETLLGNLPGQQRRFRSGEMVFLRDDPVRHLHLVRSGSIHLLRSQSSGATLILQRAGPIAVLAESSLYSDAYHCDGRAETDAETWAVPIGCARASIAADGEAADAWGRHLAREVQRARLQAEILSMRTVRQRLDAWIAWHGPLPAKGAWLTIALEIGVTPEALYREIGRRRGAVGSS